MNIESFTPTSPGRIVRIGHPGATHAFIPDPLPKDLRIPEKVWHLVAQANRAIGAIDGTGRHLTEPDTLLRPLSTREAHKSSTLEGTYTRPEQLLLFEMEPREATSEADPANATREVFNYTLALQVKKRTNLPFSLRLIKTLHETLMTGVRGKDKQPGEFRKLQNQIGRLPRFVPPPPTELMNCLDSFERSIHDHTNYEPLVKAFVLHYQFEAIHPFADGNGRVGRVLLSLMIEEWCGLSNPWIYMSPYFDKHREEYEDRLLRVSTHNDWPGWLEFCLAGAIDQAKDAQRRCDDLLELKRGFHSKIGSRVSARLPSIIDNLFIRPIVVASEIKKAYKVSFPTACADIEKLKKAGVLDFMQPIGNKKYYYSPKILDIIYRDY